ncbi:GntR family transcriptional regulator [Roseomonas nepalensis]|uniref:GntR family transcriptional regulator n=2 Tax=Muricoccus nepalensis TaxID=1854500 RepID=A0A502FTJ7_9PROT|nr:GntR family transcriptional regulator [Roseomonas nepalensis]
MCLEYRFWPRQQLLVDDLATLVHSSATPVREAVARLAGEGLIDAIPNRGYFAKALSAADMQHNIALMFMLLRNVVERPDILAAWKDPADDRSPHTCEDAMAASELLFRGLAALGGNQALTAQGNRILDFTRFVRRLDLEEPRAEASMRALTEDLRGRLVEGDAAAARAILDATELEVLARLGAVVAEGLVRSMPDDVDTRPTASPVRAFLAPS